MNWQAKVQQVGWWHARQQAGLWLCPISSSLEGEALKKQLPGAEVAEAGAGVAHETEGEMLSGSRPFSQCSFEDVEVTEVGAVEMSLSPLS